MLRILHVMYHVVAAEAEVTDMNIAGTIIATLVASVIGAATAVFVGHRTVRNQHRQRLIAQVDRIVDLAITYPFLESDAFCKTYHGQSDDECFMRYDNYCCQVFNLLERLWMYAKGNSTMMREFIYFEELVHRHKVWWQSELENKAGYDVGFREFVDGVLS